MTRFFSLIIVALFYLAQFPFSASGYVAHFIVAFWFFGWSKAEKHQDWLIALSEKRTQSTDQEAK